MSLGLATKGILPDFTGTGSGTAETKYEYVEGLINIETIPDTIIITINEASNVLEVPIYGETTIDIEIIEDTVSPEELEVEIISESTNITVEV